jgi:hypothetical protein
MNGVEAKLKCNPFLVAQNNKTPVAEKLPGFQILERETGFESS